MAATSIMLKDDPLHLADMQRRLKAVFRTAGHAGE